MTETHRKQVGRILEKLDQARQSGLTCFGAESHQFRLNPPIDEQALSRFEAEHRITLPSDYRSFLQFAGNGGAGPYYGIYALEKWEDFVDWTTENVPPNILSLPCPLQPDMDRDTEWQAKFSDCVSPYQGMISIGTQGCTYGTGLIVTGEYAGRVIYLDADGQQPYVVREPDFLTWYERWLDELLGGYDTDFFGYGIGGDEPHLLKMLETPSTPNADRIEAIHALRRLPELSPRGQEMICNLISDSVSGVRAAACSVTEKFGITGAREFLPELLHDESVDVQRVAIDAIAKIMPEEYTQDILQLMQSEKADVAKHAFFKLKEQGRLPREILLQMIQSTQDGGLRGLIAWAIKWQPEDETLLIRLLRDENTQVRTYAILGLRQQQSRSSLTAVIDTLAHESDRNNIDSILRMLGEVPGDNNSDALLKWADRGDDFQRLCALDSLCKLGEVRAVKIARALLGEVRPPKRLNEYGSGYSSHTKSIHDLACESLRSSPNAELRNLVSTDNWWNWLRFWKPK